MTKHIDRDVLAKVLPHYNLASDECSVSPLGNGLINSTFLVRGTNSTIVLQKINNNVFKKPTIVIDNAQLICQHLSSKKQRGLYSLEPIAQLLTTNEASEVVVDGQHWRALQFIPNCLTIETVTTLEQAQLVSGAFAQFTAAMADFPAKKLEEIIPNFHNLSARLSQLQTAINQDKMHRVNHCQELIERFLVQQPFIDQVSKITPQLPVHVTHNDTKISNLLFSANTNTPLAVIDLDTCMPGYLMHDFGDMVRTCCSNLAEDDKNIDKMSIRWDVMTALAIGYIDSLSDRITNVELESLIIGAKLLPFMIGMRFLTDYLEGDIYFHTTRANQNLERAENQLKMFSLLQANDRKLRDIIIDAKSRTQETLAQQTLAAG